MRLIAEVDIPFDGYIRASASKVKPVFKTTDEGMILDFIFKRIKSKPFNKNIDVANVVKAALVTLKKKRKTINHNQGNLIKLIEATREKSISNVYKRCFDYLNKHKQFFKLNKAGDLIVTNSRSIGKYKRVTFNMQHVTHGNLTRFARATYFNNIKEYLLYPALKDIEVITEYPLSVVLEIHRCIPEGSTKKYAILPDLDNVGSLFVKSLLDFLQEAGKLPQDNIHYIRKIEYEFIESKLAEEKANLKIYKYEL